MARGPITIDGGTVASDPAKARISKLRWFRFYPVWPLIWGSLLVLSFWAVYFITVWLVPIALLAVLLNAWYWRRVREHFEHGDTNPGLVIAVNPTEIAVATDLTQGVGSYPAVKVIRTRLRKIMGEKIRVGMRLPTVALYSRGTDSKIPYWVDFNPVPVECGTSNRLTLERITASFNATHWGRLDTYTQLLPSATPGLYRFEPVPSKSAHLVSARIADHVGPIERSQKYSEPLDDALRAAGLGRTTGGGTMLDSAGTVEWVGIDIELTDLEEGIRFTLRKLGDLGAPAGSILECCIGGTKLELEIDG
jgi:hypothetical protein